MATTALPLPTSPVKTVPVDRGRNPRKRSEGDHRPGSSGVDGSGHHHSKVPLSPIEGGRPDGPNSTIKRNATMRVKKMSTNQDTSTRFPKLNDCAHFHYDQVELTDILLSMHNDPDFEAFDTSRSLPECLAPVFTIRVSSKERVWLIKRSYEDFRVLDKQLHSCIYDRRFSQLVELPKGIPLSQNIVAVRSMLSHYLSRFSQIAGDMINCGPVLNWMEIDKYGCHVEMENHGNHVIANDESAINIPAVAAAHVIKRYAAQAPDEISLEVGDMISVIDMPPLEETSWWRGKNGFDVGFFPSQCVELIGEHLPPAVAERVGKTPKPDLEVSLEDIEDSQEVLRKQGKLILFLRSFILARPTKRGLKERGILRERVFSCDLGEHLLNSGSDIPLVVKACTEFIEKYGIVDGIYRQSGVASNVQRLRDDFDCDILPDLTLYQKDAHCVSSVCKLYFRELPNPLLTYQLYKNFEEAAMSPVHQLRLMHDAVQQLPPPHYRTLEFLTRHLAKMSSFAHLTGMNVKNLAIVWAPNLLRSKDIEVGSCAAFLEIKVQATVVEFLIRNVDIIFNNKLLPEGIEAEADEQLRPKSMVLSAPTKLLTLEEARARSATMAEGGGGGEERPRYIEVGGGPSALPKQYHTVIELPYGRKNLTTKSKKSAVWRTFFSKKEGKSKAQQLGKKGKSANLRSARSEESLSSTEAHLNKNADDDIDKGVVYRRSRSSSVVESVHRSSSHDSFFELDPQVIATATRDFIESTASAQKAKHQDDRSSSKDDRSSPQWIDQSISSAESETPSSLPRDSAVFTAPVIIETDDESEQPRDSLRGAVKPTDTLGGAAKPKDLPLSSGLSEAGPPQAVVRRRESSKRNVKVQTPVEEEFPQEPSLSFLNSSGQPAVYFNLEGAVLGSASPRKSAMFKSPDVLSPSSPRYSLDAVMSEYDQLMEKYGTQELTPDFVTSSDSLAATLMSGTFTPTPTDKVAPIASADSVSSTTELAPIPPPRRESRAPASGSPGTPTVDAFPAPLTPPGEFANEDQHQFSRYSFGSQSVHAHSSENTAIDRLYSVDASEVHLENVSGDMPSPVLSTGTDFTGDTLLGEPPPVTSIDDVLLGDSHSLASVDVHESDLNAAESRCTAEMNNLSVSGQEMDTSTMIIPISESDLVDNVTQHQRDNPERGSDEDEQTKPLPEEEIRSWEEGEMRNVFTGGKQTEGHISGGVGREGALVGGMGSTSRSQEERDALEQMVTGGRGRSLYETTSQRRRTNQAEPFTEHKAEGEGAMRGSSEKQGEGRHKSPGREEGEVLGEEDDLMTTEGEDEGAMHALPGETIIISDIIEL